MRIAAHGSRPPLLVGRSRERDLTRPQLGAALAGQDGLVILSGEAGIGKTALAEDACREASAAGALVLVGRCYDRAETPPPLGVDDVRTLIDHAYPLPPGDARRLAAYLQARAEGNPFFLGELPRSLPGTALARTTTGGWTLGALDQITIPVLLRQVIDARLARFGEEGIRLLAVGAVIGQVVPLALWATVVATTEEALLPLVERAIEARVLDAAPDGLAVRFAHALIREALYEGVLPPRRRGWRHRIAEARSPARGGVADGRRRAGGARLRLADRDRPLRGGAGAPGGRRRRACLPHSPRWHVSAPTAPAEAGIIMTILVVGNTLS
jgi:hypothetical protein